MTAPFGGLSAESLLSVNLDDLETTMMEKSPTLWTVLHNASSTPQQLETLTYKTHSAVSHSITSIHSYSHDE